jgi:hypothetical protein
MTEWQVGFRRPPQRGATRSATVWVSIRCESKEEAELRAAAVIAKRYPGKTYLLTAPAVDAARWREMGAAAHRAGELRVPAQSKTLIDAMRGESSINAILTEWLRGWDAENLKA